MSVKLTPSQEKASTAFSEFLNDPEQTEFILSGFAGTGKTFLVQHLVEVLRKSEALGKLIHPTLLPREVYFTAVTNKAACVLEQFTNDTVTTIHKLLGLVVKNDWKTGKQTLTQQGQHHTATLNGLIIIDEASMISEELLQYIRAHVAAESKRGALNYTPKILYIGDPYQLPPVGEATSPVFRSSTTEYELEEVQRQSAKSPITNLALQFKELVNNDTTPKWPEIVPDDKHIFHYTDRTEWTERLHEEFVVDPNHHNKKIVAWTNAQVSRYNHFIRKKLQFPADFVPGDVMISNSPIIAAGGNRILLHTEQPVTIKHVKDYWQTLAVPKYGEIHKGRVKGYNILVDYLGSKTKANVFFQPESWSETKKLMSSLAKVKDWNNYFTIKNTWADFRPGYAQTVHKSQGSTYNKIFIDVNDIGKNNKWYEVARLMYVALSRPQYEVHIYGTLPNKYSDTPSPDALLKRFGGLQK